MGVLAMRKRIGISLMAALLVTYIFPLAAEAAQWEAVYVYAVDDLNDEAIIIRENGDVYWIEYGVGVLSIWRYEGKAVYIYSPGIFAGVTSRVYLPDGDQDARIWNSEYLGNIYY